MPTKTVDLLLNLEAKPAGTNDLLNRFKELEAKAKEIKKTLEGTKLMEGAGGGNVKRLTGDLQKVEQEMKAIHAEAQKRTLEKSLKAAQQQANQLRERMEKVQQIGNRMMFVGGAMVAPFALAVRKYVETVGEGEETSRRIIELQERWAKSQVDLGRVTAEIVLPALEKALDVIEKITAFAEKNPEAVKAALGIGASLVVLGGIVSTTAQIISTIATVQGLIAGAGLTGLGGAAAGGAGIASAISAGISAAAPILAIAAAVIIAAELTRRLMNWALGTDTTWKDIGTTLYQLVVIATEGWKILPGMLMEMVTNLSRQFAEIIMRSVSILSSSVRGFFTTLGQRIYDGFVKFGNYIRDGFGKLAAIFGARQRNSQGAQVRDSGGYVGKGLWANKGAPEFVLSNNTTRAAESVVGGGLTQARLLQALAGGGSKRVSYHDARRFDSMPSASARRMMTNEMMNALAGAL